MDGIAIDLNKLLNLGDEQPKRECKLTGQDAIDEAQDLLPIAIFAGGLDDA